MIDAATQILSTMKTSGNSADKFSASKIENKDSSKSFTSFYDRSKTEIEKNKPESSKKQKETASVSQVSKNNSSTIKEKVDDKKTKKSDDNSETRISKNQDNEKTEESTKASNKIDGNTEVEEVEKDESVESLLNAILNEASEENQVAEIALLDVEDGDEIDKKLVDSLVLGNTEKGLTDLQLPEDKLGEVATAIIQEVKASIDNVGKKDEVEEPAKLSRAQILENIKNVLDQDLNKDLNIPAQLLRPDLSININASKVLGEQLNLKNANPNTEINLEPEIELLQESDVLTEADDARDELLKKIIDKLDFNKVKNGVASDVKTPNIIADKASISDFVDQLSPKLNTETSGSVLLSQTSGILNRTGTLPALQQFTLNTRLNQPEWGSEFSKRINFMVTNDIRQAELRLDPPELGRINIKIVVNQDQASVVFSSAHGNVREAIENSLPRLREMLQESGIQLGDANVNEQQQEKANQSDDGAQLSGPVLPENEAEEISSELGESQSVQHSVDGLIDYFA